MLYFDVIIIGAGPAGLNCAKQLENSGKSVLILEKNAEVGPKVCAGGLTQKDIDYLKPPQELLGHSFSKIFYVTPKRKTKIKSEKPFIYTCDRKKLGQWQLSLLDKSQIEIRNNTEVNTIGNDYLTLANGGNIRYKYLVGADGSASLVRRHLKIPSNKLGIGIQYKVRSTKYKNFELHYNNKLFGAWYAWIFPQDGYASIGTGGNPKKVPASLIRKSFHEWLDSNNIDVTGAILEAFPINNDYRGIKFNNIFLAGDAAGLASEFNGEGIYQALISGEEIARLIIDPYHKTKKLDQILALKRRHAKILKILESAGPARTSLLELISLAFRNNYLKKWALNKVL